MINVSRRSNVSAQAVYRQHFDDIVNHDPRRLLDLDLTYTQVGDLLVPMIKYGSCGYEANASAHLMLADSVEERIRVDAFLVVPEINRVLACVPSDTGLNSALSDGAAVRRHKLLDGLTAIGPFHYPTDAIRLYDSHLSVAAYWQMIMLVLDNLNIPDTTVCMEFSSVEVAGDLGMKWTHGTSVSHRVSDRYLVSEEAPDSGKNRGLARLHRNPDAPIDARILVIGDSHTYTVMGQIFSFIFREVHFYWSSRALRDGGHWEPIERSARVCEFKIEEMAEQFFLANFCRLATN